MSRSFGVVVLPKDIYLYLIDSRNIHPSVVQDHPLRIGGEGLEILRIFVASRQGGVSYLRKVGTNFGVLIEGRKDILDAGVLQCGRSSFDCIEEVSGEDGVFRIEERGIHLLWLQEGHSTFACVFAKGVVGATGQCIWLPTSFARAENNFEVEPCELLCPPGLSTIVHLRLGEPQQVLVIREYNGLLAQSFEVMSVMAHCFHDRQHFFVVDLIVELRRIELAAPKGDGVELACLWVALGNNSALGVI